MRHPKVFPWGLFLAGIGAMCLLLFLANSTELVPCARPRLDACGDVLLDELQYAAEIQDETSLQQLVTKVDINRHDDFGDTALIRTTRNGWVDGCQILLQDGADPNATNFLGQTPCHFAARLPGSTAQQLLALLQAHGADVDRPDCGGYTPLMGAIFVRRPDLVEYFIRCRADVNHSPRNGWTALHQAFSLQEPDIIQLLLRAGANLSRRDDSGQTAIEEYVAEHKQHSTSPRPRGEAFR
jgi:ankyrin repeat protein